jgi:hypothetical protein
MGLKGACGACVQDALAILLFYVWTRYFVRENESENGI